MIGKYDALTGLKVDAKGLELTLTLLDAERNGQTVGVLFVDLDKFHLWNHTHGHAAGDTLLRHLADMMRQVVGAQGEVCRVGGEEFLITLPMITLTAALELAERLRGQAEQQMLAFQGQSVPSVTMTLGVALYPDHGKSAENLYRAVEEAVMRGKHEGRNCVRVVAL